MPNRVLMIRLTQAQFDALAHKDSDALYFTEDSRRIYKGADCYSLERSPILDPGGGEPGQVLIKTSYGYCWAWASQFQTGYELVLCVPLSGDTLSADTGQTITKTGTPVYVYDEFLQRNCLRLNGTNFLTVSPLGLPEGMHSRSLAVWAKSDAPVTTNKCIFSYGSQGANKTFGLSLLAGNMVGTVGGGGIDYQTTTDAGAIDQTVWNHYCVTNDGIVEKLYINGVQQATKSLQRDTVASFCRIGTWITGTTESNNFIGSIADLRLYNGVLSVEEIETLATP